jgi:hypothetical protein
VSPLPPIPKDDSVQQEESEARGRRKEHGLVQVEEDISLHTIEFMLMLCDEHYEEAMKWTEDKAKTISLPMTPALLVALAQRMQRCRLCRIPNQNI